MDVTDKFALRLQKYRKQANLTQIELADKIGLARSTISKWEKGTIEPSLDMLIKTSAILDVSINELLGIENENNESVDNKDIVELINLLKDLSEDELAAYLNLLKARQKQ